MTAACTVGAWTLTAWFLVLLTVAVCVSGLRWATAPSRPPRRDGATPTSALGSERQGEGRSGSSGAVGASAPHNTQRGRGTAAPPAPHVRNPLRDGFW